MICLGAAFKYSNWDGRCGNDFLLETQVRRVVETIPPTAAAGGLPGDGDSFPYLRQVLRLEMLARYLGENNGSILKRCIMDPKQPWYALSLMQRTLLAAEGFVSGTRTKKSSTAPSKHQLPPSLVRTNKIEQLLRRQSAEEVQEQISWNGLDDGAILIPATSCSNPTKSTKTVKFLRSFLGGRQLYVGEQAAVEYTLDSSSLNPSILAEKRTFNLSCYVCTVHHDELPLLLTVTSESDFTTPAVKTIQVPVPYTVGMWTESDPVKLDLGGPEVKKTVLRFGRQSDFHGGISMKFIRLVEVPPGDEFEGDWTMV